MSNKAKTMQNRKRTLTPKLRFPEFRDNGEWEQSPLGVLTDPITERAGDSDCVPYTVTAGEGLISQEKKYGRIIAGNSLKNYYLLKRDDFAFNKSATKSFPQGYIARFQGDERAAVPNSIFTCFRISDEDVDAAYLDYLFQGNLHGRWLKKYITIGARAHGALNISDDDLYTMPIPMPAVDEGITEQQKIAACLNSLDGLIAAEGRMLEALKAHKKGLMQQLFPQPGQTQPRLRFPEFQDKGEWEERALEELANFASGGTPSKTNPKFWDGDIPWISASSMHDTVVHDSEHRVTREAIGNGTRLAEKGSILILVRGSMLFKRVPICIAERDVAFNQDVKSIRPKRGVVTRYLLYHLMASESGIVINETGIGAGKIDTEHLKLLIIGIPSSAEQQKIADSLTALDTRIAAQAAKIETLKQHKRGLMQQLFPATENDV